MATTTQLRADIDKLKKAIASKFTPKSAKSKLEAQLKKVEKELADKKAGKTTTSTTASTKATFKSLKDLVRRTKELSIYKGSSESNLQNDAERKALPSSAVKGRRTSQGLRSNQYGDKGSNKGHIYYEYRKNRIDVKQPKSKQRYPILEDGGMMAKGGEVYKIQQKYKYELQPKWEDEKFQTGGRHFLSFKDAQDFKKKLSGMSSSMEYKVIKVEDKMADGGMMAKGGISEKPIPAIMDDYGNINSEKKLQKDLEYLKEAYEDKSITKDEYNKQYNEIKEQIKLLQKKENGGMMAKGGDVGKDYNVMYNVGKVKYLVNFHDGIKKYDDGSAFYDIRSFKNKRDLNEFISKLKQEGYKGNYAQGGMAEMEMPNGGGIQSSTHKLHR